MQDVAKIGRRGDIAEVPDGYAMNQLIPKQMAQPATAANLKRAEKMKATSDAATAQNAEAFAAATTALTDKTLTIETEVNDQGGLFKAVSEQDIVDAAATVGATLAPDYVQFADPIKTEGEHTVTLAHEGATTSVAIKVVKK